MRKPNRARSIRFGQEAVAAKRHWSRPHGLHTVASVAAWRHHSRPATPRLQLQTSAQDVTGRSAVRLSAKLRDGELKVVQDFSLPDHKSKGMRAVLSQLEIAKTVLLVDNGENKNLVLGSRNLEGVTLVETKDVTVYNLLGHAQVVLSETAAKKLSEALAK